MYYVLMTDVVRIPSPSQDPINNPSDRYVFGISLTGYLEPSAAPPPDPDLTHCVTALSGAGASASAIAAQLGPIAPWTWQSFDGVVLTDGTATLPLQAAQPGYLFRRP